MSEVLEEVSTVEDAELSGPYAQIAAHYKEGVQLTDEELDTLVDVALGILREILAFSMPRIPPSMSTRVTMVRSSWMLPLLTSLC